MCTRGHPGGGRRAACQCCAKNRLARSGAEAARMRDAAISAGIVHMASYSYRFYPAGAARQADESARAVGRIYHFRSPLPGRSMVDGPWAEVLLPPYRRRR